jgi:hypothetical protein
LIAALALNGDERGGNQAFAALEPDLRARVQKLIADVKAKPTTAKTVVPRARVLWQWANAYALAGHPIHPDLPQTMTRLLSGQQLSARASGFYPGAVDGWVRELAFVEQNPGAIGRLTSPDLGPFTVDTFATFVQTYTVGTAPIKPGGGFLFTPRAYGGGGPLQTDKPQDANYLTIKSSNPNVEFESDTLQVIGMFSGALGGNFPRPYFKLTRGRLNPGDTVTVTLGDTSGGGPGTKLGTTDSSAMRYRLWVKLDENSPRFPLPELPFTSRGGPAAGVRGFAPSVVATGEHIDLTVRSEDAFRNRATSGFKPYRLSLNGKPWQTVTNTTAAINTLNNVRFDEPGVYRIAIESTDGRFKGKFNPILVEDNPTQRVYWGETHGHSGFAEGSGTVDNFYRFAREDAKLDFTTLSEHDLWMDDYEWEVLRSATIRHRRPGDFETFIGYEWTVNTRTGGHHNVLFRTPEGRRRVENQRAPLLPNLFKLLRAENREEDVLVIPHAHNPGHYWEADPEMETMLEIVSNHGTFEWLGRAFLSRGNEVGFIGGSDDHIGHPGLRPLRRGHGSDNQGGFAAAVAPSKSRDSIFDALRNRSAYATNGQRIILRASVNGRGMGEEVVGAGSRKIEARAVGTGPIESITVVKNGVDVHTVDYSQTMEAKPPHFVEVRFLSTTDPRGLGLKSRDARRWQGTINVRGANVLGVRTPNVENVYTEGAKISEDDPRQVGFYMRTRGSSRSIVLELDGPASDARIQLKSHTGPANNPTKIDHTFAGLGRGAEVLATPVGEHPDTVIVRAYTPPTKIDRRIEWTDTGTAADYPEFPVPEGVPSASSAKPRHDSYYVRVIQTDGGMAWSTPIWVKDGPSE